MDFKFLSKNDLGIPSAALRISGPDANTYLQGQFTQDLRGDAKKISYGLWLNQKGKTLADSYILREAPDRFVVLAPRVDTVVLRERLEAYLIADEVTIDDLSATSDVLHVWSTEPNPAVGQNLLQAGRIDDVTLGTAHVFPLRSGQLHHFAMLVPTAARQAWIDALVASGARPGDWAEVERDRIAHGIPAVPDDIGPNDLPNEGGLDEIAISYTKGCYLGQEVMARLKNLGQVRRRLHVVRGPGEPPTRGSEVFQGAQRVGDFRSAVREGDGFIAFAMLSLVNLQPGAPLARQPGGAADIALVRHG